MKGFVDLSTVTRWMKSLEEYLKTTPLKDSVFVGEAALKNISVGRLNNPRECMY